jgi:hypothetical protein
MPRNPQQNRADKAKQERLEAALRENLKRRKAAQKNLAADPVEVIEPGPDSH